MGAAIRAHPWASTPLGPAEGWPQALRTMLRVLLSSRYAMWLGWGPELIFFCNDAYRPTLGQKAGWALGSPTRQVWAEVWPEAGPRIEHVLRTGEATWDDALLLFLERNGYPEETYHTFSYSPAPDDAGGVGGMLCVVAEETERVLGDRRLATLAGLAAGLAGPASEAELWRAAERALAANPRDLPFTRITLFEAGQPRLAARTGLAPDIACPDRRALDTLSIVDLPARPAGIIPGEVWSEPPRQAVVLKLAGQGEEPAGFVVAGVNPFRPLDEAYIDFLRLLAVQIAAGLAGVRSYQAERQRAEALAALDQSKSAFFANVSHEFRTPLTLMLAPLEDLLGSTLEAQPRAQLEIAHRNSLRLLRLVNTLLDFSRLEAGRLAPTYEEVDLAALTAEIASGFEGALERAGLSFDIECVALSAPAYVDRDMWEKVTLNLLSNAFKFTFEGGVAVSLREADGHAVLSVCDTGVGIPGEELPRIFERFHRIEGQRSRSFEGSGIGLALSAELVRLHGGTIEARSGPAGSEFLVTLPLGSAHLPPEQIGRTPVRARGQPEAFVAEALRWLPDPVDRAVLDARAEPEAVVLVADDNADMRDHLARLLGGRYEVLTAADGMAALETLRTTRVDLLLTDVMMPVLDGFGLLREIRAGPLRGLPVILLSARAGEEARAEGLDAGADDYLTKPFSARELTARVGANLAMARVRQEIGEALRARTAELETVLETVPLGVWFTADAQAREVKGNRAAAALLRLPPEANPSLSAPAGKHPLNYRVLRGGAPVPPEALPLQRAARGEEVFNEELDIVFDDGTVLTLRADARPIRGPDGAITGAIGTGIDVSHRKRAEQSLRQANEQLERRVQERTRQLTDANARLREQIAERERAEESLRQSQKMEAVGQLTGGLAHDFNNLLAGIAGNLELLQSRAAQGRMEDVVRHAAAARGAAERAAALTHRLLAFSRRQTLEPKTVNANRLIGGLEEFIGRTIGPSITLEVVKAGGLWATSCDPNQLENALLNLCINARDAMPDGGRLTIETENSALDLAAAGERDVTQGQYVGIYVTDTGTGMTTQVAARAFDPFFTTKPLGQGTGLGLSMVYGFARQSGGQVRIYSEVGRGTSVKLYLPRQHGPEMAEETRVAEPDIEARAPGRETVLVVDDEPTVRMLVTEVLADLGYVPIEAADGPSALRTLAAAGRIDLLITDVGLPGGLNGRQLADAARVDRPDLKVLFITGYAENAAFGNGLLEAGMQVIAKPFAIEKLAARIRAMFEATSGAG